MEPNFRTQFYSDIYEQYSEGNRLGMCELILNKHEIQHYSLREKNHTVDLNHYIVKNQDVRSQCNELINKKSCSHEELVGVLDNLTHEQLSIIGF